MAYFKDFFRLSSTRYRRVVSHLFKQSRRIENMLTISWSQFHSDICVFAAWYQPDILNHPAAYLSSWPRYQYLHSHVNISAWLGCKWLGEQFRICTGRADCVWRGCVRVGTPRITRRGSGMVTNIAQRMRVRRRLDVVRRSVLVFAAKNIVQGSRC